MNWTADSERADIALAWEKQQSNARSNFFGATNFNFPDNSDNDIPYDIDDFREYLKNALEEEEDQFSIGIWAGSYPGGDAMDEICLELSLEEGLDIKWEATSPPGSGKCDLLLWWF